MKIKNHFIHSVLDVFRIRRPERVAALVILAVLVAMNAMVIAHYFDRFTSMSSDPWGLFVGYFHISGFDPITYYVVTDWHAAYNIYRHPLLAFYMYVPYLINQGLMAITGANCAMFVMAAIQIFCGLYSAIFIRRIFIEIVGLRSSYANLLTAFFFSFAYILLSTMVPDHFVISMLILILSLYVAGRRMKSGRPFKIWQTVAYFFLTGGTSLNNGLKIFLAALFVNGRRFFKPKFLLLAVLLPSALIWGAARLTYHELGVPFEKAKHLSEARHRAEQHKLDSIKQLKQARLDSMFLAKGDTAAAKAAQHPKKKKKWRVRVKPISKKEFLAWTDISTPRLQSAIENVFGETIQLHQKHTLQDMYGKRPVIVKYSWPINYAIEAIVVLLFALGIWHGRRSRFLWLAMSYFAMDAMIHFVLGFALNEVYIMAAHWAFAIPIAAAYLLKQSNGKMRAASVAALGIATAWLWIYNVALIIDYLC